MFVQQFWQEWSSTFPLHQRLQCFIENKQKHITSNSELTDDEYLSLFKSCVNVHFFSRISGVMRKECRQIDSFSTSIYIKLKSCPSICPSVMLITHLELPVSTHRVPNTKCSSSAYSKFVTASSCLLCKVSLRQKLQHSSVNRNW